MCKHLCLFIGIIETEYNIPVGWVPQKTSVDGLKLVGELKKIHKDIKFTWLVLIKLLILRTKFPNLWYIHAYDIIACTLK